AMHPFLLFIFDDTAYVNTYIIIFVRRPLVSTLFPYTTLFRSCFLGHGRTHAHARLHGPPAGTGAARSAVRTARPGGAAVDGPGPAGGLAAGRAGPGTHAGGSHRARRAHLDPAPRDGLARPPGGRRTGPATVQSAPADPFRLRPRGRPDAPCPYAPGPAVGRLSHAGGDARRCGGPWRRCGPGIEATPAVRMTGPRRATRDPAGSDGDGRAPSPGPFGGPPGRTAPWCARGRAVIV